jgi:CBS domain containing-hemolysin-like protein
VHFPVVLSFFLSFFIYIYYFIFFGKIIPSVTAIIIDAIDEFPHML